MEKHYLKRFPNSIPKKTNIAVNDKHYSECVGSVKRTAVIQTEGTLQSGTVLGKGSWVDGYWLGLTIWLICYRCAHVRSTGAKSESESVIARNMVNTHCSIIF